MQIAVIGSGYVGLVTGACFAEFGVDVTCVDVDAEKIAQLALGKTTIYEPGLDQLVKKNLQAGRLRFTTDSPSAIQQSLVIFLAVGTPPTPDGSADLSYVEDAARKIAEHMDSYKVVATKSTVPVGTGKHLTSLIRKHQPKPVEFSVVSNPEFLREGAAYRPLYLIETPFVITSLEGAELIKYAANAFLATKISFINEIANLCEKVGCDIHEVARAIGMDRRIGSKFLHAGPGFGGSCFPKDTRAFSAIARQFASPSRIVDAVIEVNYQQRLSMVPKIDNLADGLSGKRVAVLGLAFKPETDDMRDAPSVDIIRGLVERGALVSAYDPVAADEARKVLPEIEYADDEYEAVTGAEVLVFMTEWNQFRALDMERIRGLMKAPRIADLRNIYEPIDMREMGFEYVGVGR